MKIAFVTNLCAHYNVGTFELLSRKYDVDYYFFSAGKEWYWPEEHGYRVGKFKSAYLPGFQIGRTWITPSLPWKLLLGGYDVYIKCINGRFALPITYLIARLRRKPLILWTGVWTRLNTPIQRLIFPMTRFIYRHSDAIVVYGEHVKRYLVSEGVDPDRIFVAAHAIKNEFYNQTVPESKKAELRSQLGVRPDQKLVLYLGRLEEIKGISFLVKAFSQLDAPDAVLVIAGSGSLRQEMEELANQMKIGDRVRFIGYVTIEDAPLYYSLAWTCVLPSITVATGKETWGLVINEAFNQGVPVIATDSVGAAQGGLVQEGVNGFIVPEKNSHAICIALERLITEPDLHELFGKNAKKSVADWDYERNVLGYQQAIEYVTKNSA